MEVRSLVAWNIRRLRVRKGVSQDDLANMAEVDRAYVGHLERGTKNPTIVTLEKLVRVLDAPMSELFVVPQPGQKPTKTLRPGRKTG